jgi:UDP-N-acetylmuramate dehydrogenase
MPTTEPRQKLEEFGEIVRRNEPLAPYTALKIGGPAEMLVQPRTVEELASVIRTCAQERIPTRVLGTGGNILVRDEGVRGVVLRLVEAPFIQISVNGQRIRAGAGASLSTFISEAARHGLAGLESLVGVAGTVGGALRCNAGERSGEVGQFVRLVEVLDDLGQVQIRQREELRFAYRWSNLDDPVLLAAEFELDRDDQGAIVKRLRKTWIQRKATQPLSYQAAGRVFKAPSGFSAAILIAQAGLVGTRVGGAEISERDANFIVAEPGTSARDVLRLIDMIQSRVRERSGTELELEMAIWG